MDHVNVIIVGAGLSGVGAAAHLVENCPEKTFTLLEGRAAVGGTWDLFRYPGIRSDSDMHTLGYSFKPWTQAKSIADGPSIGNTLTKPPTSLISGGIFDSIIKYRPPHGTRLNHAGF